MSALNAIPKRAPPRVRVTPIPRDRKETKLTATEEVRLLRWLNVQWPGARRHVGVRVHVLVPAER